MIGRRKKPEKKQRQAAHGKRKEARPWYLKAGGLIYHKIPAAPRTCIYRSVKSCFTRKRSESPGQMEDRCRLFIEEECAILFWGVVFLLVTVMAAAGYLLMADHEIHVSRNPFGQGDKEQELLLGRKSGKQSVTLTIEEQQLSPKEREELFDDFFRKLQKNMCGRNRSLQQVESALVFDEKLDGFPFSAEYQPEDLSLVGLGGELGEKAGRMKKKEKARTSIQVTAAYRSWSKTRTIPVTIVAPEQKKKEHTAYDEVEEKLKKIERSSAGDSDVAIPGQMSGIRIWLPERRRIIYGGILLAAISPAAIILRRYYRLKEAVEKKRREEEEDFAIIVHEILLFIKAGLSVSSSIHRISANYLASAGKESERQAFEEIVLMDRQMKMGVSQKEACVRWAERSRSPLYQKLALALVQILVKGSREGREILERMEKDAFEQRIDRARKEGKITETRLLFPMVVLLFLVMIIVLFPALLRFRGF